MFWGNHLLQTEIYAAGLAQVCARFARKSCFCVTRMYPNRTDLLRPLLALYRLDWIDSYPVHGHITRVDELVSNTPRYQNRIPCCDGVFLTTEHEHACPFGDERLMFPFMRVIGAGLARSMFYVEHYVARYAITGTEYGIRASLFVTYYGFHSACLTVAENVLFREQMILNRFPYRTDCRDHGETKFEVRWSSAKSC